MAGRDMRRRKDTVRLGSGVWVRRPRSPLPSPMSGFGWVWGAARPPHRYGPPSAPSCAQPVPRGEVSAGVCPKINDIGVPSREGAWMASLGGGGVGG